MTKLAINIAESKAEDAATVLRIVIENSLEDVFSTLHENHLHSAGYWEPNWLSIMARAMLNSLGSENLERLSPNDIDILRNWAMSPQALFEDV